MNINIPKLDYRMCYDAHRGTSFVPDERAEYEVKDFERYIVAVIDDLTARYDIEENENRAQLEDDVQRFVDGYYKRKVALLQAQSRHVSAMIAGPSGYNTRQMSKRAEVIDNRIRDLVGFADKALDSIRTKHNPNARHPVMAGQDDATEQLTKQLEAAEALQEMMKAANKVMRGDLGQSEKMEKLREIGVTAEIAKDRFMGAGGFPRFALTNNGSNIRRLKARLAEVSQLQNADEVEHESNTLHVYEDAADNRIRIEFDGYRGHPANEWLKAHAWRWSRLNTAWQRQITRNARESARAFVAEWDGKL